MSGTKRVKFVIVEFPSIVALNILNEKLKLSEGINMKSNNSSVDIRFDE
jgi:hypothetical protein